MKTPQYAASRPIKSTPFEANEALRKGDEMPLEHYLADLAKGLSLLANSKHQPEDDQRPIEEKQAPMSDAPKKASLPKEDEEDWDASLHQFEKVLREGDDELIASYLREASKVISEVSRILRPVKGARDWKLEFRRAAKGRPPADRMRKFLKQGAITRHLRFATQKYGKKEAAIAAVTSERNISRATVLRAEKEVKKLSKTDKVSYK